MSKHVKIDCPNCKGVDTVTILGTIGSNVDDTGKIFEKGVAVTECEKCGHMIRSEQELSEQLKKLIPETKTIGIVVDNFKLNKYKIEIIKAGFFDTIEEPFTKTTTSIIITVKTVEFNQHKDTITKLCVTLEHYFKNKN